MRRRECMVRMAGFGAVFGSLVSGCGSGGGSTAPSQPSSGGGPSTGSGGGATQKLVFWHTRRGDQQKALEAICADFGKAHPGVQVLPEYQGNYGDLNKKIRASIQAKSLPALTVAYESHVTEYMTNGVVRPLDDLVTDPAVGLSKEELAAIPEAYLQSNRFAQFENKLLSFPFTKSNLVMYFNRDLLKKSGFDKPPTTWEEFETQAAAISKSLGGPAWAFAADPSTLDGMIYSFGGQLVGADNLSTEFGSPAAVAMLSLLKRMAAARQLVEAVGDEASGLFTSQRAAFYLDTSSTRSRLETDIAGKFDWGITIIPHAVGVAPVTVMYGPNVCIFKASPEQEKAAWEFIKYFVSPEVTGRWARETGYLPVTRRAIDLPEMKSFYESNARARAVWDILPSAKPEPNLLGWQEVRDHLQEAAHTVISGSAAPQSVAAELKRKSDQALKSSRQ